MAARNRWDLGPPATPPATPATPAAPAAPAADSSARNTAATMPPPNVPGNSAAGELPNLFFRPGVNFADRETMIKMIRERPETSIIAQFARGTYPNPPPGASKTECEIYKDWHHDPDNLHFSLKLEWVDDDRNSVAEYGRAHLHENGLEFVFERESRDTLVMRLGKSTYDVYDVDSTGPPREPGKDWDEVEKEETPNLLDLY